MRLLFLGYRYGGMGGVENAMHKLSRELGKKHDITVLASNMTDRVPGGVKIRNIPFIAFLSLWKLLYLPLALLYGLFCRFDVICAFYATIPGLTGVLLKKLTNKPLIVSVRGWDVTVAPKGILGRFVVKTVLNNSDAIIAVSQSLKNEAEKLTNKQIDVIYNGVEIPKSEKKKGGKKQQTILYVGGLRAEKAPDILINAFKEVLKKHKKVRLVIVGDGYMEKKLKRMASGVKNIDFRGFVRNEKLSGYYNNADIIVIPSLSEGLPNTLLEAMAFGLPVIASRVGGIPEVVGEENGVLVEPGDQKALSEGINKLFKKPRLMREMGKKNRKKVELKFSQNTIAKQWNKVLFRLKA